MPGATLATIGALYIGGSARATSLLEAARRPPAPPSARRSRDGRGSTLRLRRSGRDLHLGRRLNHCDGGVMEDIGRACGLRLSPVRLSVSVPRSASPARPFAPVPLSGSSPPRAFSQRVGPARVAAARRSLAGTDAGAQPVHSRSPIGSSSLQASLRCFRLAPGSRRCLRTRLRRAGVGDSLCESLLLRSADGAGCGRRCRARRHSRSGRRGRLSRDSCNGSRRDAHQRRSVSQPMAPRPRPTEQSRLKARRRQCGADVAANAPSAAAA